LSNTLFNKTKRNSDFVSQGILLKKFLFKKPKFIFRNKVILLFDEWSDNYYHFLNEFVTRLFVCKEFIIKEKITLIVPYSLKDKIKIFTDLMGISAIAIIKKDDYLFSFKMYYCDLLGKGLGTFYTPILTSFRDYLFVNLSFQDSICKDHIYITRSTANKRKILNENDLLPLLDQFCVRIVDTNVMTIRDQIVTFQNCKLLIGAHGAGLSNMLFMSKGSIVIEIRPHGEQNNIYMMLASCLGLEYYVFYSEKQTVIDFQQTNFEISVNSLRLMFINLRL
jgi:capsular polysaccharide biosynthesis protein